MKWKLEKIAILPFGGLTYFNEDLNRPILEELLVCLAGPMFQVFYYLIVSRFVDITYIHYSLLAFNLLPIIPLDGSKLFNLIFNKVFPFRFSYILSCFVSIVFIIISLVLIIFMKWNLLLFLTLFLLIIRTLKDFRTTDYIFNRFILERYVKNISSKKIKKIKGMNLRKMFRDYRHIFIVNKNYYTEKEIIKKRFDLQWKVW